MGRVTYFLFLTFVFAGCGSEAPLPPVDLTPNTNNSVTAHPDLNSSFISVSGAFDDQNGALISAFGIYGSVTEAPGLNFVGSTLRLEISQLSHTESYDLTIVADSNGNLGFNIDSQGNPLSTTYSFGSFAHNLPLNFTFFFEDVELLHGQFFVQ